MEKPDEEDDYLLNSWLGLNALNVMIQQQVLVHMSDKPVVTLWHIWRGWVVYILNSLHTTYVLDTVSSR